jgi:hypothetical protein
MFLDNGKQIVNVVNEVEHGTTKNVWLVCRCCRVSSSMGLAFWSCQAQQYDRKEFILIVINLNYFIGVGNFPGDKAQPTLKTVIVIAVC